MHAYVCYMYTMYVWMKAYYSSIIWFIIQLRATEDILQIVWIFVSYFFSKAAGAWWNLHYTSYSSAINKDYRKGHDN